MTLYKDNAYKLLHRTSNTSDETDYVAAQTMPSHAITIGSMNGPGVRPVKLEVCVRWIDTTPTPDAVDLTDVGAVSISFIRSMRYVPAVTENASTAGLAETIVVGTTAVATTAFSPLVCDELLPGDRVGVRLTGMTASAGAEIAEVYYRLIGT